MRRSSRCTSQKAHASRSSIPVVASRTFSLCHPTRRPQSNTICPTTPRRTPPRYTTLLEHLEHTLIFPLMGEHFFTILQLLKVLKTRFRANYLVAIDGNFTLTYGTSCSSPVLAAFFSAINDARLGVGKGPIGFINPTVCMASSLAYGALIYCSRDIDL